MATAKPASAKPASALLRMPTWHIVSNSGWNILGRVGPIGVALLVTPRLITHLGLARWGVMTIALTLVGTFGIFDFGLGRALTRAVAERVTEGRHQESADLTMTGILTLSVLGIIGGLVAALGVVAWVQHGLKIPDSLRPETTWAMWVLCATAPLVMANAAMWGVISAYQAFRAANLINIPISIGYYVAPLLILLVWNSLVGVMITLALCRVAMTIAYAWLCLRVMPQLRTARPAISLLRPLFRIGGWMTVSNLMFPILSYMDRFMIASVISSAATSYYTTPFDVVARLSLITNAVTGTAFPAMASLWRHDSAGTIQLYRTSVLTVAALLFPFCLVSTLFGREILAMWVGGDFPEHSTMIMKFLSIGVFFFGVDGVAAGFLDGIGRPDFNAVLSVIEFAVYAPLLLLLLHLFGVDGAAIAWAGRSLLDCVIRIRLGIRFYPPLADAVRHILPMSAVALVTLGAAIFQDGIVITGVSFVLSSILFYAILWTRGLSAAERASALSLLKRAGMSRSRPA
ncbi:flippase [Nguyenibacter vanlangensis]|uniref:Flippase n=2 Tax=Nguyenibacter vanlangensis TaxID=1216886 RepID=A0A7Y7M5K5_9PROT|nr:flippase [Nguyenibacter vanlangensis]